MGKVGGRNFGEFMVIRQRFPPTKASLYTVAILQKLYMNLHATTSS